MLTVITKNSRTHGFDVKINLAHSGNKGQPIEFRQTCVISRVTSTIHQGPHSFKLHWPCTTLRPSSFSS